MTSVTDPLVPVLGMILVGFIIRRSGFVHDSFWPSAEKLTYFILMPATLIHNLSGKQAGSMPWLKILMTVEGTVIASALLVILWWLFNRSMSGAEFTSLFQGGVRFNTFVALALAENLFGREGLFIAALGAGFMIILINVLCVSAFSIAVNHSGKIDLKRFAGDLARNPLIIGCVIGVGLNVAGLKLPAAIDGTLALAGKAAFPVGLMAVGAAYRVGNISRHLQPLAVSSVIQFVCKPLIAWWLATSLGLSGTLLAVAVILFSVPTAPSAYILSRQMGGDSESMSAIITFQTCLSFILLPLTVWLLQGYM